MQCVEPGYTLALKLALDRGWQLAEERRRGPGVLSTGILFFSMVDLAKEERYLRSSTLALLRRQLEGRWQFAATVRHALLSGSLPLEPTHSAGARFSGPVLDALSLASRLSAARSRFRVIQLRYLFQALLMQPTVPDNAQVHRCLQGIGLDQAELLRLSAR